MDEELNIEELRDAVLDAGWETHYNSLRGLNIYGDTWEWSGYSKRMLQTPDGYPVPVCSQLLSQNCASPLGRRILSSGVSIGSGQWNTYHLSSHNSVVFVEIVPLINNVQETDDYYVITGNYSMYVMNKPNGFKFEDEQITMIVESQEFSVVDWEPVVKQTSKQMTLRAEMLSNGTRFSIAVGKTTAYDIGVLHNNTENWTQETSSVNREFSSFFVHSISEPSGFVTAIYSDTMEWEEMEHLLLQKANRSKPSKDLVYKKKTLVLQEHIVSDEKVAVPLDGLGFSVGDGLYLERIGDEQEWVGPAVAGKTLSSYFIEPMGPLVFREPCRLTRGNTVRRIPCGVYEIRFSKESETTPLAFAQLFEPTTARLTLSEILVTPIRSRLSAARGVGVVSTRKPVDRNRTYTNTGRFVQTDQRDSVRKL